MTMQGKADTFAAGRPDRLARLMDVGEQAIFVIALMFFHLANIHAHNPTNYLVVANDAVTVFFLLIRRHTTAVSRRPSDWALAFAGTLAGMLMRPGGTPLVPQIVPVVMIIDGLVIEVAAKLSLNRSFGIAPANRGVQARWAYRFIRHPMYFGYLLIHVGYLLANPTPYNLCVNAVLWGCQFGRILREEEFLLRDPAYRAYAQQVRYRLVPLLF
jgi:protein-S-isoprenylcysteine O-methyltransferase Ste14